MSRTFIGLQLGRSHFGFGTVLTPDFCFPCKAWPLLVGGRAPSCPQPRGGWPAPTHACLWSFCRGPISQALGSGRWAPVRALTPTGCVSPAGQLTSLCCGCLICNMGR